MEIIYILVISQMLASADLVKSDDSEDGIFRSDNNFDYQQKRTRKHHKYGHFVRNKKHEKITGHNSKWPHSVYGDHIIDEMQRNDGFVRKYKWGYIDDDSINKLLESFSSDDRNGNLNHVGKHGRFSWMNRKTFNKARNGTNPY